MTKVKLVRFVLNHNPIDKSAMGNFQYSSLVEVANINIALLRSSPFLFSVHFVLLFST